MAKAKPKTSSKNRASKPAPKVAKKAVAKKAVAVKPKARVASKPAAAKRAPSAPRENLPSYDQLPVRAGRAEGLGMGCLRRSR